MIPLEELMRVVEIGGEDLGGRTSDCERMKVSSGSSSSVVVVDMVATEGEGGGGGVSEVCWFWRMAWSRAVRALGSVVLRREVRVFGSVVLRRVVRRVDKSVTELWGVESVIVGSVCRDGEGDGIVDIEEQREAEAAVMWEEGEGESGVIAVVLA